MNSHIRSPIGSFTLPIQSWNHLRDAADSVFIYVDLSSINQQTKEIENVTELTGTDAPSRARQVIRHRDVLISTVRPNLNAVAWVPSVFDGATASTGFCVLRPNLNQLDDR